TYRSPDTVPVCVVESGRVAADTAPGIARSNKRIKRLMLVICFIIQYSNRGWHSADIQKIRSGYHKYIMIFFYILHTKFNISKT
ncbi:MAG TPA: hypothetical protein PKM87_09090, partial [Methanolinea sp.]|nr:hypothetical protein [Methanolinea sp.]